MDILNNKINELKDNKINELKAWWDNNREVLLNVKISIKEQGNTTEYQLFQRKNTQDDTIPYLEITPLYRKADGGILFVTCNPSGTEVKQYANNTEEIFTYENKNNEYWVNAESFAKRVFGDICQDIDSKYAMIDVFPIVLQKQTVLERVFKTMRPKDDKLKCAFNSLIQMFLETVKAINPRVIVVANAFVRKIFMDYLGNSKYLNYNGKTWIDIEPNKNELVCYHITRIMDDVQQKIAVFCGGAFGGRVKMDKESEKRLSRDVKYYIKGQSLDFKKNH